MTFGYAAAAVRFALPKLARIDWGAFNMNSRYGLRDAAIAFEVGIVLAALIVLFVDAPASSWKAAVVPINWGVLGTLFAGTAALAATAQAFISNHARRDASRAYVSIAVSERDIWPLSRIMVKFDVKNHGGTPASQVRFRAIARVVPVADACRISVEPEFSGGFTTLHPGQQIDWAKTFQTDDFHARFQRGEAYVQVFAQIEYTDIYGYARTSSLLGYYERTDDGDMWIDCNHGNNAT